LRFKLDRKKNKKTLFTPLQKESSLNSFSKLLEVSVMSTVQSPRCDEVQTLSQLSRQVLPVIRHR